MMNSHDQSNAQFVLLHPKLPELVFVSPKCRVLSRRFYMIHDGSMSWLLIWCSLQSKECNKPCYLILWYFFIGNAYGFYLLCANHGPKIFATTHVTGARSAQTPHSAQDDAPAHFPGALLVGGFNGSETPLLAWLNRDFHVGFYWEILLKWDLGPEVVSACFNPLTNISKSWSSQPFGDSRQTVGEIVQNTFSFVKICGNRCKYCCVSWRKGC